MKLPMTWPFSWPASWIASFTRRAAYCECVRPESRTLQSTASVWSAVIRSFQAATLSAAHKALRALVSESAARMATGKV